jgi:aspartate carbamoyltransferase catalytic subunit
MNSLIQNCCAKIGKIFTGSNDIPVEYENNHIIHTQQFNPDWIDMIFGDANSIWNMFKKGTIHRSLGHSLEGKRAFIIFTEPSTRTFYSFWIAAETLGMKCNPSENAKQISSLVKGEPMSDMIEVLCQYYPSLIIMRQSQEGMMEIGAGICDKYGVTLINAGDGSNQHPTQALLDLYAIQRRFNRTTNLKIILGGDLRYGRTIHSLAYLLAKYPGIEMYFVSPKELALPKNITEYLDKHKVKYSVGEDFRHLKGWADVLYWTRVQVERIENPEEKKRIEKASERYVLSKNDLSVLIGPESLIMHPLPIYTEVSREVDSDPRALYKTLQVQGGLMIRTALIARTFDIEIPRV